MPGPPTSLLILLLAGALGGLAVPEVAGATVGWQRPVPGPPLRSFSLAGDSFAAGSHRGVDLEAPRGAAVRATCRGRVAFAGRVGTTDAAVTLVCGPWRVTHLPVQAPAVAEGERVAAGERIGSVGADSRHRGLHLGVRRAGEAAGYVDPLAFLPAPRPPRGLPAPPSRRPPARRRESPPDRRGGLPDAAPGFAPDPRGAAMRQNETLAPPLAWMGLAILLGGSVGVTGWTSRARRVAPSPQEAVSALR